jgi:HSP20 family protein
MDIVRRQEQPSPALSFFGEWEPFKTMHELMRWDPFRAMRHAVPSEELKSIFVPDMDIKETPSAYVFKADLPGIKEKDVELSITGNRLALRGKREEEKRDEKANYYTCERFYGSFTRSFTLPAGTDPEHASADLKDGVLTITVPKKPEVQPKQIPVNGGEAKAKSKA